MSYLFTSESVSEGHPDKVADQISDALLDEFLRHDPNSKVACETLVTTGLVMLSGEVRTNAYIDVQNIARDVIRNIGYTKSTYKFDSESCAVLSSIHEQSPDINQGVVREKPEDQGAGDQGMMFGYATAETETFMPVTIELSHLILQELAQVRREGRRMRYLAPDSKSQVTVEYADNHKPLRIDSIVVSTQHDDFVVPRSNTPEARKDADEKMLETIRRDVNRYVIQRLRRKLPRRLKILFKDDFKLFVNPTGKFVVGGPHGDTGLTGRKIIVDTYGGWGAHGGGAFSGKDSSKVDRSGAYAARHIAKNIVGARLAKRCLVQVSYAIGVAEPVGIFINTYGTAKLRDEYGKRYSDGEIAQKITEIFDLRPYAIIERFGLKNPIFLPTASYGHVGRFPYTETVTVYENGEPVQKEVEFFGWEKLDYVMKLRDIFQILD
ncbi:MAG: methionine adenosyltransferase [Salinivirgaceae bacterium]|nr:methionine adenosyltransferase [Salinivirgaceae bacterium]MDD4746035.1 methionine adenosyltransferase [Salinivirgaceae bacterium]